MILSLVSFSTDSRIRNADLGRFTGSDRLVGIINRLSARVEIKLKVTPSARTAHACQLNRAGSGSDKFKGFH